MNDDIEYSLPFPAEAATAADDILDVQALMELYTLSLNAVEYENTNVREKLKGVLEGAIDTIEKRNKLNSAIYANHIRKESMKKIKG